ncbi:MAG: amidohydrolase [Isosphaeraceae bacterium]|nr:amidohydrolase [Isosphaeraceae bacterium]
MKRGTFVMAVLCATSLVPGIARSQPTLSERVEKELPAALDTYKAIHAAPELSHYEEKTAASVAKELKAAGCDVFTGIGKFTRPEWKGHGVAGVLTNGGGPVVLIRAELDALPITEQTRLPYASKVQATTDRGAKTGVMHACGHDLHLAAMIGTARLLAAQKDRWRGTVVFVAQPAEETLDGVKAMLADGLFKKVPRPDYCLALHCIGDLATGEVGITPGPALASVQVLEVTVRGKGGHGSRPHEAKDPVVVAAQIILALQTIVSRETSAVEPVGVTVGAIQGGTRASIIPEEVRMLVSVRALDDRGRDRAVQAVERIAKGTALAAGVPEELAPIIRRSEDEKVSGTYNDPALSERLSAVFARELGADKVLRIKPRMAGDDFAHFGSVEGKAIPSLVYLLGTADPQKTEESRRTGIPLVSVHNPRFAPIPGIALRTGMRTMTSAVLDLLSAERPGK